jgi:hypothetical protein
LIVLVDEILQPVVVHVQRVFCFYQDFVELLDDLQLTGVLAANVHGPLPNVGPQLRLVKFTLTVRIVLLGLIDIIVMDHFISQIHLGPMVPTFKPPIFFNHAEHILDIYFGVLSSLLAIVFQQTFDEDLFLAAVQIVEHLVHGEVLRAVIHHVVETLVRMVEYQIVETVPIVDVYGEHAAIIVNVRREIFLVNSFPYFFVVRF